MNNEHEEQTRWLVDYLETRFGKLEDRLDRATDRVDHVILAQTQRVSELEKKVDQVEDRSLRLESQAGFLKNVLAFVGTAVLSLVGWLVSYWFSSGK